MKLPSVSFVIPTYNSERTLGMCLESIKKQDYPKSKLEIVIADGGSTDSTIKIAKKFKANKIVDNTLKTGEAGKAVGIKHASNEIIALVDSDNILPSEDWLKRMVEPFEDGEISGSEPLYYTHRKQDEYIDRYCALIGMNDPICLFFGNYDRFCYITNKWTEVPVDEEDKGNFLKIKLNERKLPTIGANGFLVRKKLLKKCSVDSYFFDIDVVYELVLAGHGKFAKVKVGIIHMFCSSVNTFFRKQRRRIKDFGYYEKEKFRKYPWSSISKLKLLKFIFYSITVVPLMIQSIKGWFRKRDSAWLFHIPACWITLLIYGLGTVRNLFFKVSIENRDGWRGQN